MVAPVTRVPDAKQRINHDSFVVQSSQWSAAPMLMAIESLAYDWPMCYHTCVQYLLDHVIHDTENLKF